MNVLKEITISVNNLSKVYHLYNNPQDRLKEALNPFKKSYHKDFYALNDVSFNVYKGEKLGIIGSNGAGKSTLLKLITGVLTPSSGNIEVNGKIASLLELGAGFNPELSGLENIYLNGTLMGFTHKEISKKVNSIIEFADIGDFINHPTKKYSSGMFARLAFSVAINVEPDILIIDEALSVGDMAFQAKCMARMKQMTDKGITLLFVSHDIYSVQSLCDRAIFIDSGKIFKMGDVETVTSIYMSLQRKKNNNQLELQKKSKKENSTHHYIDKKSNNDINKNLEHNSSKWNGLDLSGKKQFPGSSSGNNKAKILDFLFINQSGEQCTEIKSNDKYTIRLVVKFNQHLNSFVLVCPIRSLNGVQEIGVSSSVEKYKFPEVQKGDIYLIEVESVMNLQHGIYNLVLSVEVPIKENEIHEFAHVLENCITFNVIWGDLKFPTKCYTTGEFYCEKKV